MLLLHELGRLGRHVHDLHPLADLLASAARRVHARVVDGPVEEDPASLVQRLGSCPGPVVTHQFGSLLHFRRAGAPVLNATRELRGGGHSDGVRKAKLRCGPDRTGDLHASADDAELDPGLGTRRYLTHDSEIRLLKAGICFLGL